jgi:hypothetical protein
MIKQSLWNNRVRDSSENVFLCCACGKKILQRIARPVGERPKIRQKEKRQLIKNELPFLVSKSLIIKLLLLRKAGNAP